MAHEGLGCTPRSMHGPHLNFQLPAKTYMQKCALCLLGSELCSHSQQAHEQVGFMQILKTGMFFPKSLTISTDRQQSWL